jgi:5-methylcytosine-specific restriction endonuclease McrA
VNKTQVKKLLVAERKSMREKQKQSAFLRKTNNIYRAMKKRAADAKQTLDFTLEELRKWTGGILGAKCFYCSSVVLTVGNFTWDHDEPIARDGSFSGRNLRMCCKSCNFQKGILTHVEFADLLQTLKRFDAVAQADIKRRLTIGGKWGVRVG